MKKSKLYLSLKSFEEDGVIKFGWEEVKPGRLRKPSKILNSEFVIKISQDSFDTYISGEDVEEYINLSLGFKSKDLLSKWSSNLEGFELEYSKKTLSYENRDGEFFLNLCNLLVNGVDFIHNQKEITKV